MITAADLRPGRVLCETAFFRAFMSGENELTLQSLMVYPVGGRRWTKQFQGRPDDPEVREILGSMARFVEDTRGLAIRAPERDEPERWYAGVYRE